MRWRPGTARRVRLRLPRPLGYLLRSMGEIQRTELGSLRILPLSSNIVSRSAVFPRIQRVRLYRGPDNGSARGYHGDLRGVGRSAASVVARSSSQPNHMLYIASLGVTILNCREASSLACERGSARRRYRPEPSRQVRRAGGYPRDESPDGPRGRENVDFGVTGMCGDRLHEQRTAPSAIGKQPPPEVRAPTSLGQVRLTGRAHLTLTGRTHLPH
jgi:hypothetical protein